MGLHQTWITDAVIRGWHSHTAPRFLHDNGEDKAMVQEGLFSDGVDCGSELTELTLRVGGRCVDKLARGLYDVEIHVPSNPYRQPSLEGVNDLAERNLAHKSSNEAQSSISGHPSSTVPFPVYRM